MLPNEHLGGGRADDFHRPGATGSNVPVACWAKAIQNTNYILTEAHRNHLCDFVNGQPAPLWP